MNAKRQETTEEIFKTVKDSYFEGSPYMKTRVLAVMREQQRNRKKVFFWQKVAGAISMAALAVVLVVANLDSPKYFDANMQEALAVRLPLEEFKGHKVAYAEIELDNGVEFYSQSFPEISEQVRLNVDWNKIVANNYILPIVVKGMEPGTKVVRVKFMDENQNMVDEKVVPIRFVDERSS